MSAELLSADVLRETFFFAHKCNDQRRKGYFEAAEGLIWTEERAVELVSYFLQGAEESRSLSKITTQQLLLCTKIAV